MGTNIFEIATRNKYRFPYKGLISVEDLWDLGQDQLDLIFRNLNKDIKQTQEASLLCTKSTEDAELRTKIDIVRFIFDAKKAEETARKAAAANAEKRRLILDILAQKQDENLRNKDENELLKMLEELND